MQTAKIRVKLGQLEVDYEGEQSFLEKGLDTFILSLTEQLKNHVPQAIEQSTQLPEQTSSSNHPLLKDEGITSVIVKMSVKNLTDLLLATAAYLTLMKGQAKFDANNLRDAAKQSTKWEKKMTSNVASSIKVLKKQLKLINPEGKLYQLSDSAYSELRSKLSG